MFRYLFNIVPCSGAESKIIYCVRVFINRTKPGSVGLVGWMMGMGRNSPNFDGDNDLVILDDCDKTVREICKEAGWEQDLDNLQVQILEP